jgi:hypothetical protein
MPGRRDTELAALAAALDDVATAKRQSDLSESDVWRYDEVREHLEYLAARVENTDG